MPVTHTRPCSADTLRRDAGLTHTSTPLFSSMSLVPAASKRIRKVLTPPWASTLTDGGDRSFRAVCLTVG
ncbi:Uncharacterized protein DAT39_021843 [Clarias magur]|uniref:Uncharacterized protein n=1 Tax=Clarias magur TaxID=1594786 RepID=A0A8J4TE80_CLAMG|nr:Uncharacterized protein DAT39_021843 [Clarias magur]